jgi:predicted nucleic acid-binding protein
MILVDTSVWVDHLRKGDTALSNLLEAEKILCHPLVVGELALGMLRNRRKILSSLQDLPQADVASHDEVMAFIEKASLYGKGIGLIDAHLLASCLITGCPLWTKDARLKSVTAGVGAGVY